MTLLAIGSFVFCYQFDATYPSPIHTCSFILLCFNFSHSLSLSLSQFSHVHDGGICEIEKGTII